MRKLTISAAALTLLVAGFVLAQVTATPPTLKVFTPAQTTAAKSTRDVPLDDVRLRIEGERDGRVIGTLMVKVNGQWVDVVLASKNMRAADAAINR
jgi:hypothetical protein